MAIFVNYYPCSYGDSLVAMFKGLCKRRHHNLINCGKKIWFKQLDFYSSKPVQQQQLLEQLKDNDVVSCHRQYQFDFGSKHQVVSLVLNDYNWLLERVKHIHLVQLKKKIENSKLLAFADKIPIEKLIEYDYKTWAKYNVLQSDIMLNFDLLYTPSLMEKFCKQVNLKYQQSAIDDILENLAIYNVKVT